jgi:hypothetical protein
MRDNFISTIVNFDTEDVTDDVRMKMKKYLENPDYNFEKVFLLLLRFFYFEKVCPLLSGKLNLLSQLSLLLTIARTLSDWIIGPHLQRALRIVL